MLPRKQSKAFAEFCDAAYGDGVLGPKTTLAVKLATAMAVGCYPCMRHYLGVAEEQGLTEDEIGAIEAVVMAVSACRIRTQLADAQSDEGSER